MVRVTNMSTLASDFTGCSIFLYDTNGNQLGSTVVRVHDRHEQQIQVNLMPSSLKPNDDCKVFLLTSPVPCEFSGKIKKSGGILMIAMFQGQVKENRGAMRYAVNTPAQIEALIIETKPYYLQTQVEVTLINISISGIRFRAPNYSFNEGDIFRMNMIVSNSTKQITAKVINCLDKDAERSDYGCQFMEVL